ncbi:MAG: hypothetical protein R3D65_15270 [Zhengella sp.]|uniref:hypothetical protein n=1 Tax=Zhengella sp. TaxID=2282762 RepID=UPI001DEBF9BD|nr:hypothetical protein [Notoacmeibacter sp.]MCC0026594.1 hypothetical protein [Brucellaceae bacterium]
MRGIAFLFVATAALFVTIGMVWGIQMSASGNHMLSGAHAHLNLIGWVTMGLFGFYYHLVPAAAARPLAKVHYGVATLGVLTIVPGIVMVLRQQGETLAAIGSVLTILSMLIFLYTVLTTRAQAA